jgi:PAS domain S-box-containing protein
MDREVFFVFVFPLIVDIALGFFLVFTLSRHRITPAAKSLMVLILGAFLWSFGYSMEFLSAGLDAKIFWARFQYFGIAIIPLAWFSFAFQSQGGQGWPERPWKQRAALAVLPILTIVLVWTNELHRLIWSGIQLQMLGPFPILVLEHGPMFWVYLAYSYALLFTGSLKLLGGMLASFQTSRRRTILTLVAVFIPWLSNLIYLSGINPIPNIDWTPFAFTIAALLFCISLYPDSFIDILPIAQKTVFAEMPLGLVVLDARGGLVEMNPAAREMIGSRTGNGQGKRLDEVLPEFSPWLARAGMGEDFQVEISAGEEQEQRFYNLRAVSLAGSSAQPEGSLVVCSDITGQKRAQAQLEQIRDQLEDTVAARTEDLNQTVGQLQVELTRRTLAEKRFESVVESMPNAVFLVDQAGAIVLVNQQAERLFGYSREELLGQNYECLIVPGMRRRHQGYARRFLADPSIRQVDFGLALSARRRDGEEFPVEISLGTIETGGGFWIACITRDITDRKKAEEEQNRLFEEIRQSREQLRALAVRLSEAQEYEQRQIAIELHDRVGQNLTGLSLNLQIIQNQLQADGSALVRKRLEDSIQLVEETTRQVRSVMADLNPPLLEEYGLGAAVRYFCDQFMERTGIDIRVRGEDFCPRLPQREEKAMFRIVQEGLTNVAKHARATRVEIRMESMDGFVKLSIEDNGQGFPLEELSQPGSQPHWGLLSIQERAASIGGELQIYSAPGQGTCLKIVLPGGKPDD